MFSIQEFQNYTPGCTISQMSNPEDLYDVDSLPSERLRSEIVRSLVALERGNEEWFSKIDLQPNTTVLVKALVLAHESPRGLQQQMLETSKEVFTNPVWHDAYTGLVTNELLEQVADEKSHWLEDSTYPLWENYENALREIILKSDFSTLTQSAKEGLIALVVYAIQAHTAPTHRSLLKVLQDNVEPEVVEQFLIKKSVPGFGIPPGYDMLLKVLPTQSILEVVNLIWENNRKRQHQLLARLAGEDSTLPLSEDFLRALSEVRPQPEDGFVAPIESSEVVESVLHIFAQRGQFSDSTIDSVVEVMRHGVSPKKVLEMFENQ